MIELRLQVPESRVQDLLALWYVLARTHLPPEQIESARGLSAHVTPAIIAVLGTLDRTEQVDLDFDALDAMPADCWDDLLNFVNFTALHALLEQNYAVLDAFSEAKRAVEEQDLVAKFEGSYCRRNYADATGSDE